MTWERITAADIQEGDRVARSRTREPQTVLSVQRNAASVWLEFPSQYPGATGTYRIRPGYGIKFWKAVD